MGKKLAIKGHPTRGEEIIELLKMLGDCKNAYDYTGCLDCYYYITEFGRIESSYKLYEFDNYIVYTLEEFLEKFPFKVGDFVRIPEYESEVRILKMKWCSVSKHIEYMVCPNDDEEWYTAEELLDYNDNPNEIPKVKEKKINQMSLANCDLDEVEIVLGDKFELKLEDGKYYAVRKKPKKPIYPTTYGECKNMIPKNVYYGYSMFMTLQNLIICRDVYWDIYGKQTGLGEPWKPTTDPVYGITRTCNLICTSNSCGKSQILEFPTEEMRDAFYENFKKEIEQCKELL